MNLLRTGQLGKSTIRPLLQPATSWSTSRPISLSNSQFRLLINFSLNELTILYGLEKLLDKKIIAKKFFTFAKNIYITGSLHSYSFFTLCINIIMRQIQKAASLQSVHRRLSYIVPNDYRKIRTYFATLPTPNIHTRLRTL